MAELFTGITVQGLYNDQTGAPLYGVLGAPAPTSALFLAGTDGTNLRGLAVDSTGKLNVNATISVSGVPLTSTLFGSPAVQALNVFVVNPTGSIVEQNVNVNQVGGAPVSLGQKVSAVSFPVVIASDQSAVLVSGTVAVSSVGGTVAVTQSTSPWVVSGTVTANQGGAPWSQNLTQLNSVVLGSPTSWGTAASGNVIGVNAELFAGNIALTTTSFGSPTIQGLNTYIINPVTQGTTPWLTKDAADGTVGAVASATVIQVGGSDGANLRAVKVTSVGTTVVIPADQAEASSLNYFSYDSGNVFKSTSSAVFTYLWSIQANSASITFLLRELQWFTDGSTNWFQLIKNGTLTGTAFIAGPGNIQVDTAGSWTSGTGTVVFSGYVSFIPRFYDNLLTAMASGVPGDTFTVVAKGFGNGRVAAQIRWSEQSTTL